MRDRKRVDVLLSMCEDLALLTQGTEASKILRELEPKGVPLATKAVGKLEEYSAGWPAGGNGAGGATNITHEFTEPDGSKVMLTVPQHPDRTGEQVAEEKESKFVAPSVLDDHLRLAAHHLSEAAYIAAHAVVTTHAASEKARDDSDDWCASCARVLDHKNRPRAEPSQVVNGSVRRTPDGTANGAKGLPLCGWCYGFVLGEKAWPPKNLIERRADGYRVSTDDVDKAMGRKQGTTAA